MAPLFELRDLCSRIGRPGIWNGDDHRIPVELRNIDLSIEENELLVIAGANGSGKTRLLRHLVGLEKPNSGKLLFKGEAAAGRTTEIRRATGLLFQNSENQMTTLSVKDEIAFGPRNLRLKRPEIDRRVEEAAKSCGVLELLQRDPHRLSGGEQKRVALASILSMEPRLILMDEPFTGLDYPSVRGLLSVIEKIRNQNRGIVVVTHDLEKILAMADRLAVLERGRIVYDGNPEDALENLESWNIRRPRLPLKEMAWL